MSITPKQSENAWSHGEMELPDDFGDMSEFDRMLAESGPAKPLLTARDLEGFSDGDLEDIKAELSKPRPDTDGTCYREDTE
jgi:hypothetical protein